MSMTPVPWEITVRRSAKLGCCDESIEHSRRNTIQLAFNLGTSGDQKLYPTLLLILTASILLAAKVSINVTIVRSIKGVPVRYP